MKSFISGSYRSQGSYKSFQPNPINRAWTIEDMELINLLSQADRQIGRLDMYSEYIPNIDLFISMHVYKEATTSSRIEGTQTNIDDMLLDIDDVEKIKRDDWQEVQNYIESINTTIEQLKELPFSTRLIRSAHKTLMQGVRGQHKLPGEFRKSQNWIGGASISDALFVPPTHDSVNELMGDLENFVHNTEIKLPDLLKIALVHYQFETIHPFLDGNGRVGRLLITLYLIEQKLLKRPILYLSDFLERNKSLYYDNLTRVRTHNDIKQWFKFFLVGIIETAKSGVETFDKILQLKKQTEDKINTLGTRAGNAKVVLDQLFKRPAINAAKIKELTGLSKPSVYKLIEQLEALNILKEITGAQRGKIYFFDDYLKLFY